MIINGVKPGAPLPEKRPAPEAEQQKVSNEAAKEQVREEIQKQETHKEEKKEKFDYEKLKLDEYSLKELLFLMSSRGNTETIEKLAMILKKEKEALHKKG